MDGDMAAKTARIRAGRHSRRKSASEKNESNCAGTSQEVLVLYIILVITIRQEQRNTPESENLPGKQEGGTDSAIPHCRTNYIFTDRSAFL